MFLSRLIAGLALLPLQAAAQLPPVHASLVKDIDTAPSALRSSSPEHFLTLGARVYFSAAAPETGDELYSTDGTGAGLRLTAEIRPGALGSAPVPLGEAGGRIIVSGNDGLHGSQIWALTEGSPAVRLTSEVFFTSPVARAVAQAGTRLLLSGGADTRLLATDGTPAGTRRLSPAQGFPTTDLAGCSLGAKALIAGVGPAGPGLRIGATDGLVTQTLAVATDADTPLRGFIASARGECFFAWSRIGGGIILLASDGTPAGTRELGRTSTGRIHGLLARGDDIFLLEEDGAALRLLHSTAQVPAPALVTSITTTKFRYVPSNFTLVDGSTLAFLAESTISGGSAISLYASDGTAAGTRRVFPPDASQSIVDTWGVAPVPGGVLTTVNTSSRRIDIVTGQATPLSTFDWSQSAPLGNLRIGPGSDETGSELWRSDGLAAGTQRINDIWPATGNGLRAAQAGDAGVREARVYFSSAVEYIGNNTRSAVWQSDGTVAGTFALPRNLYGDGSAGRLQMLGGELVFSASSFAGSPRVFRAAGDFSTASAVAVITTWPATMQATGDGQGLFFVSDPLLQQYQWNGLRAGVAGSTVIQAAGQGAYVKAVGGIGNAAIFAVPSRDEIWRSDGTAPGTFLLLAGRRADGAAVVASTQMGGNLYFVTCSTGDGCWLTRSDGSVAGTALVAALSQGSAEAMVTAGSRVVFMQNYDTRVQLWGSDGTAAGTELLLSRSVFPPVQLAAAGRYAHLLQYCPGCKDSHLVTDGTQTGLRSVPSPSPFAAVPGFMAALGSDALVLSCASGRTGTELCLSDAAGTTIRPLPEIFPGNQSSDAALLAVTPDKIYFSADDGRHGVELWQLRLLSDGIFADGFQ